MEDTETFLYAAGVLTPADRHAVGKEMTARPRAGNGPAFPDIIRLIMATVARGERLET